MGKGGGGPSQQTVTQTNVPEYAEPYMKRLLQRGETESKRAYEPYQGQRIVPTSDATKAGWSAIENLGPGITGLPQAQQATQGAMAGAQGIAGMTPFNFSGPGTYLGDTVNQYMSPYMQNVVDVEKARAQLDFDRAQAGRDAQAVQAGAFGGSRQAVVDGMAQEELSRRLGEIQAQGQQQAFSEGSRLFEADRAARMGTEQMMAADRLGIGQLGLEGYGMSGMLADQLASLGGAERQAAIEQAGLLQDVGAAREANQQQFRDLAYQDFLKQQMYPQEQLQFWSDLMRGNIRGSSTSTQQFQQANPYKDLLGAGISALSLSQLMGQ